MIPADWRRALAAILGAGAAAAGGALLFVWAGLVPIAASSGHWAPTAALLHWAMRSAVRTQSIGTEVPPRLDLSDPGLVRRGAGHYATGCAPCHGAPGASRATIALQMTPTPPNLVRDMGEWEDRELFWIVRHGVKYTAMPAWPATGREDEVWAMVAFLKALPDMAPEAFADLAGTDRPARGAAARIPRLADALAGDAREVVAESCARCHGADGLGRGDGAFPRLAGQKEGYLLASLVAYAEGERHSGFMEPVAAGLTADVMQSLAAHYAALPATGGATAELPAAADPERGRLIALGGLPSSGVPACARCHGPGPGPGTPYPVLAGQDYDYLVEQLHAFREGVRGGTPFAHVMRTVAERLEDADIRDAAAHFAAASP